MHILTNISKSKGIQTVKFGQLIISEIIPLKTAENERETSSQPLFVFFLKRYFG